MKIVKYFLQNKALTKILLLIVVVGGLFSYTKMGKLEDAPFTIKQALVVTQYPGASPSEVQSQVTDVLEDAIQSLSELYYLKTENRAGLSKITVNVNKEIRASEMQQLWDNLRRKVGDAQAKLPAACGTSVVNDDFGDVLGVFYGLESEDHTYRELEEKAKLIKKDLLKVKDVAKVSLYGIQRPTIDVVVSPSVMSQSGLTTADIARAFDSQNKIVKSGAIETKDNRIRVETTGSFTSIEEIENFTIVSKSGEYFKLKEIAKVSESYLRPASSLMKINNVPAIGIAVATTATGNVVDMAELVKERIEYYKSSLDKGYRLSNVYDQGHESAEANNGFILNLIISVCTVVLILLFFIGLKNGLLIGSGLVFSILATLIFMFVQDIALQRMSLAAIIIAMGMLVDNAIVVSDSALMNMQKGMRKRVAIMRTVSSTAIPLLAATAIAILTFMPIYLSPHLTGELLSSLFIVIAVSLLFSWVFALIQTPFFIQEFVARPRKEDLKTDLYQGKLYTWFRDTLDKLIAKKFIVIAVVVVILLLSVLGFKYIPKVFLPQLNKQYFTIDMWMPEGTKIDRMDEIVCEVSSYLNEVENVESVSSYIGQTPPRYYLANASFGPQPNYAQCLIKTNTPENARAIQILLKGSLNKSFPELFMKVNRFELSSVPQALIEARFCGTDEAVLDSLTQVAIDIMRSNPKVLNARNEWGNMAMIIKPEYDAIKASKLHISKQNIVEAIKSISDGLTVGIYRENDNKVPVMLKSDVDENMSLDKFKDFSIWNGSSSAPLSQVTKSIKLDWEYPLVKTYNRELTMAAICDVKDSYTMNEVHAEIREAIENIDLPEGYSFFWDSQFKDQKEAMQALTKYFPLAFLLLVVILIALFKNYKQALIIILILPFSFIGVSLGLLLTGFNFGFFCIAGWLGLLGMIIKNVIVLIDEVNVQRCEGNTLYSSIIEATVSRARPVLMASITTICGMIPLLFDVVFGGMAATIIFGLTFATLLTLFVTPVLYSIFYKINKK
jgi:multidrug efflux pump subunit AcrB